MQIGKSLFHAKNSRILEHNNQLDILRLSKDSDAVFPPLPTRIGIIFQERQETAAVNISAHLTIFASYLTLKTLLHRGISTNAAAGKKWNESMIPKGIGPSTTPHPLNPSPLVKSRPKNDVDFRGHKESRALFYNISSTQSSKVWKS